MLRIFAFGSNFVFRTNFVFATEFRLQRAQNRISSSHEFRLQGRFSSSNIVFAHNLSFSSWRTISSSKASEFRLQGGDETGTQFPGSMHIYVSMNLCIYVYILSIYTAIQTPEVCAHSCTAGRRRGSHLASYELSWVVRHHYSTHRGCCRQSLSCTFV